MLQTGLDFLFEFPTECWFSTQVAVTVNLSWYLQHVLFSSCPKIFHVALKGIHSLFLSSFCVLDSHNLGSLFIICFLLRKTTTENSLQSLSNLIK